MIIKQELLNILRDSGEEVGDLEKFIREFAGREASSIEKRAK